MELFAALAATWPAATTERLGAWTLRQGGGGGGRVSAATLDGPMQDPAPAEAAQRATGTRPLFMVRDGEEALDAALAARGYTASDATVLMAAPAAALPPAPPEAAILCDAPLACMVETWDAGGIGPARLAIMARVVGPKTYLLGRLGDRPAGAGFLALHRGIAMLHAIEVAAAFRRQGLAARMTRTAAAWARGQGAETLALAVTRANTPARALYDGLGLVEVAGYHYRTAP